MAWIIFFLSILNQPIMHVHWDPNYEFPLCVINIIACFVGCNVTTQCVALFLFSGESKQWARLVRKVHFLPGWSPQNLLFGHEGTWFHECWSYTNSVTSSIVLWVKKKKSVPHKTRQNSKNWILNNQWTKFSKKTQNIFKSQKLVIKSKMVWTLERPYIIFVCFD